jgi:quercetin dioxygenase-like cupin family protein
MRKILALTVLIPFTAPAFAENTAAETEVMLVGTFHMSNPGADLHNVKVDDMLAPKRQAEIEAVADALARFKPTRVAVEWPADVVNERYAKFLAGTLPASHNEVVQLGFRLAHRQGLQQVDGLDVEGDFPFEDVEAWAKAHGRQTEIDRLMADGETEVTKETVLQESTSVGGILRYLNDPQEIARNHSFYPAMLTMGSGAEQPGVKLVSAWYLRNLAICARLLQTLTPGDHGVVFYGQGHVYLLRQCLSEQPGIKVVSSLDYLPAAGGAHLTGVACIDVPAGEKRPDFGCFNVGTVRGLKFDSREVFWHLRSYSTVAAANAARSANGIVVEEDGRVWLSEFAARDKPPQGGESTAVIGPMKLPVAKSYTAVLSYAVMRPGDSSRVHTHAGPEAWYVIEGEQCLETPSGKITARAGESSAVEGDLPMKLNVTGTAIRHAFALVIHDSSRPRGTPSEWRPPGSCGS